MEAEREAHRLFSTKFDMMTAGSTWGIITDGDDASAALGTPASAAGASAEVAAVPPLAQQLRRGGRVLIPTRRYVQDQGAPTAAEAAAEEDVERDEEDDDELFSGPLNQ